ncbi:hypothetical protein T492DRAFT_967519 [Pavlovales sp. CCMP2436]|nr:hypothetical protein T492DRAFT_967519 [Pavlovales sp. CCMP2436]|mmetsp:Transcript_43155/g.106570  ORF Transcript_43155/g.106570 Transcript_43155/m.106570 type:complete len:316 (-) Transcript_43155:315-1262(-)
MLAAVQQQVLHDRSNTGGLNQEPCATCRKPVFLMDRVRIPVDGHAHDLLLHRACFRCSTCSRPLALGGYFCAGQADDFRMSCQDHAAPPDRASPAGHAAFMPARAPDRPSTGGADEARAAAPPAMAQLTVRREGETSASHRLMPVTIKAVRMVTSIVVRPPARPRDAAAAPKPLAEVPPPRRIGFGSAVSAVSAAVMRTGLRGIGKTSKTSPLKKPAAHFVPSPAEQEAAVAPPPKQAVAASRASVRKTTARALDLNRATASELSQLPGVGARQAAMIVAHRGANGEFESVDDLRHVSGVGALLVRKLGPLLRVG